MHLLISVDENYLPRPTKSEKRSRLEEDESGNKKYRGNVLLELISRMKPALGIDEETRTYWSTRIKLDLRNPVHPIPIPDEIQVNGWLLKEGSFVQVDNDPVVGACTTTLFVAFISWLKLH
ncbi:uncharacterized protein N7482_001457 [Penicillium canariense]|uniref:Uncharacterized protein n=1 Tax=Penicillium canariense TaxID=189055 RepID=A0A9W9LTK3_9EURO|nr:uncharacterized protein N7482_001457 [Penicillium canariense]KAJ5175580.1 hypothetical protein N7482_001457 [Penicillium canariense]